MKRGFGMKWCCQCEKEAEVDSSFYQICLFPVEPSSPPPPFSSCSQGNRRVEGPFPTRFRRSVFFYVPCIWLFEINVMEGVECTCRCVFRLCSHWWHCSGSAEIRSGDGKAASPQDRTEAGQEVNGVRWCFSTVCDDRSAISCNSFCSE